MVLFVDCGGEKGEEGTEHGTVNAITRYVSCTGWLKGSSDCEVKGSPHSPGLTTVVLLLLVGGGGSNRGGRTWNSECLYNIRKQYWETFIGSSDECQVRGSPSQPGANSSSGVVGGRRRDTYLWTYKICNTTCVDPSSLDTIKWEADFKRCLKDKVVGVGRLLIRTNTFNRDDSLSCEYNKVVSAFWLFCRKYPFVFKFFCSLFLGILF